MHRDRIASLLEPFLNEPLSSLQLDQISTYIDLLLRWNVRINLTAIRHEEEIVTRHFGESFFLARHLFPKVQVWRGHSCPRVILSARHPERSGVIREAEDDAESKDPYPATPPSPTRVLDIGSGAGFPALPVKIWAPQIHLSMIESNHKKAAFLREAARALTFTSINVIADRTETILARPEIPHADVVTLRAVERFETVLPQAARFLAPQGRLALLISAPQIRRAVKVTPLDWADPIHIPQSQTRVLSIGYQK